MYQHKVRTIQRKKAKMIEFFRKLWYNRYDKNTKKESVYMNSFEDYSFEETFEAENEQLNLIKKIAEQDIQKYTAEIEELKKKVGFAERHNRELKAEIERLRNTISVHEKIIEKLLNESC